MQKLKELWGVGKVSKAVAIHYIIDKYAKFNGLVDEQNKLKTPFYYNEGFINDWRDHLLRFTKTGLKANLEWCEEYAIRVLKTMQREDDLRTLVRMNNDDKINFISDLYNEIQRKYEEFNKKGLKKNKNVEKILKEEKKDGEK